METVVVYDCEFLTAPGAPQRFWCGPDDPDPLTIQIGAVRLDLSAPFAVSDPVGWYVRPVDRDGQLVPLHPLVTQLTGISAAMIEAEGLDLGEALARLDDFSEGAPLLAWGKDELLTLAAHLFVTGTQSPIPATRFRSAVPLLVRAGEPVERVQTLRSHTICAHFGLPPAGVAHDARGDAQSVAAVLQHLLATGRLTALDVMEFCGQSPDGPTS
ncbi:exonuclease [uncultured Roseobacter sp.]|uniref:exonuclease n=1 Tax=uncultured Roseobacter sp. TaxID=114847 RepID=UPI00261280DA|nr:exonuclease [uncultured Roseobacter sp.]